MNNILELQGRITGWVVSCLGLESLMDRKVRATRVLEEAIELAQAEGIQEHFVEAWVKRVYSRPPGEPIQEMAGIGFCLLAYAVCVDENLGHVVEAEVTRVSTPEMMKRIKERQAEKMKVGLEKPE